MKNFLKWGLYITGLNVVMMLIGYAAGWTVTPTGRTVGLISMLLSLGILYMGIKERKSTDPAEFTFGKGFVEGLLISLVAGVIFAVFMYIYSEYINPEMLEYAKSEAYKSMAAQNMPKEQMEPARKMMEGFISPSFYAITTLFMYVIGGGLASLIISAIVKNVGGSAPPAENS
ncbi:MAG: DUF4199 domain-containing protein [bacterium]